MKTRRIFGMALGVLLLPALSLAQNQPYAPPQPPPPPPQAYPQPVQQNTQQNQTNQTPVVVVNPNEPPPAAPEPVPLQPEETTDMWNAPVFATGALVFGASYGASLVEAGTSDHPGADRLWVPVVGPWLALGDWGSCPIAESRCDNSTTDKVLLVADGVFQAAGVITMIDGILSPTHHVVAVETAQRGVHVRPTGNGVLVFGRF